MDKKIEPKSKRLKTFLKLAIIGMVFFVLSFLVYSASEPKSIKVHQSHLELGLVTLKPFQESIPIQAIVEPLNSVVVTAMEGGIIETIFKEDGAEVLKGDTLLQLANSALMLDFMNRETQIIEQINNLRNTRLALEENKRILAQQYNQTLFDFKESKQQFIADSILRNGSAIAENSFVSSKNRFYFLTQQLELLNESRLREASNREFQLKQIDQSIKLMERNLIAIQKNLDNLTVRAPISGRLTGFNIQIGQAKTKGQILGNIHVLHGFKAIAHIDEYFLNKVKVGQIALFEDGNNKYELTINKIIPEVQNQQFEAHLNFKGQEPKTITPGQNLRLILNISNPEPQLVLPFGSFFSSTGGSWVYILDGKHQAYKKNVKLGRKNNDFIEVIDGLSNGDKVIINNYGTFQNAELIKIVQSDD